MYLCVLCRSLHRPDQNAQARTHARTHAHRHDFLSVVRLSLSRSLPSGSPAVHPAASALRIACDPEAGARAGHRESGAAQMANAEADAVGHQTRTAHTSSLVGPIQAKSREVTTYRAPGSSSHCCSCWGVVPL